MKRFPDGMRLPRTDAKKGDDSAKGATRSLTFSGPVRLCASTAAMVRYPCRESTVGQSSGVDKVMLSQRLK